MPCTEVWNGKSDSGSGAAQLLGLPFAVEATGARSEPRLGNTRYGGGAGNATPGAVGAAVPDTGKLLRREPETSTAPGAGASSTGRTMIDHGAEM